MNDVKLHEALHEVASAGVGDGVDVRLARMSADARSVGSRQTRRQWFRVAGAMVATAAVVLLVAGLFAVVRPVEGVPASGAGSLPDRIFPTREHILTLEQAPIGRVSMVFAGPLLGGVTSWVAVGADGDEYRALAPASNHLAFNANVDVAPDGSMLVVGRGGATSGDPRLELIDTGTGSSTFVELPGDGAGGSVESISWSPAGGKLAVAANVLDPSDADRSSGSTRYFVVDVESHEVSMLPPAAVRAGEVVGWTSVDDVVLVDGPSGSGRLRVSVAGPGGVAQVADLEGVPQGFSRPSISPDERLLAGLVDPTPSASGDGSVWDLVVYDLSSGEQVSSDNLSAYAEDQTSIVGWRDASTPVLSAVRPGAEGTGLLVAHDIGDGGWEVVVRAGDKGDRPDYLTSRVASDILASGNVRDAEPPHQPWYDPRTLGAATRYWVGNNTALLFLLGIGAAALLAIGIRKSRRHR